MGMGQPQAGQNGIYGRSTDYQPQVSSINMQFKEIVENVTDNKTKDAIPNLAFQNIRGHAQYKHLSCEMIRVLDMMQMKNTPQQSYEYKAMTEFSQNQQQYPPHLLQASKQRAATNPAPPNPGQQPLGGFAGGGQQIGSSFGQQSAPLGGGLGAGAFGQQQPA